MSNRIIYDKVPDFVKPKLENLTEVIPTITFENYNLPNNNIIPNNLSNYKETKIENEKNSWYNWTLSINLEGINPTVKGVETFFNTLNKISITVEQLLKILRLLSGNVFSLSSTLKYAIKKLNKEIKEFIDSFTSTGLYLSLIIPDFDKRFPNYRIPTFGGYQEFITRVNNTCLNSTDPDAPKFENEDKVGGVIIAMLGGINEPDFLKDLMDNFKKLSSLFGFKVPYPSPALKFKAVPGFYEKDGIKKLGVKLTWEAPISPIDKFFIYKSKTSTGTQVEYNIDNIKVNINVFTTEEPIIKIKYIPFKVLYSYIDFDVSPESINFYKIYSSLGDDYLEKNPYLKAINSPVSTPVAIAHVPKECIPLSELKKYINLSITGEILSPFDFEGDWQSATVRRMLGNQLDDLYNSLDVLTDKLLGMIESGSSAVNSYLKFYRERLEDILNIINKIKNISIRLSSFTQRGTFMVLNLPLEKGGMQGFVERFNRACNSGSINKEVPKEKKSMIDFLKNSIKVEKNTPISKYNETGIMFGLILLYGIPDLSDPRRFKDIVSKEKLKELERNYQQTEKAINLFLKMLGLS
jgi:hypothetical protein